MNSKQIFDDQGRQIGLIVCRFIDGNWAWFANLRCGRIRNGVSRTEAAAEAAIRAAYEAAEGSSYVVESC